ncbi:CHY zinc finger protein [Metabacillus sp. RGM 3146]|uniref:CHY zinc finger protein n=1 Tax=Metabacillus sp. RGM 3146 TaxID=3401092 RepID=UPI003B9BDF0E
MFCKGIEVKGDLFDSETRCVHYHSKKDIIAIKFYCCQTYFPCYACHENHANHPIKVWPNNQFEQKAILCGSCGLELRIEDYLSCDSTCPNCSASFNPGCSLHSHLYFENN